MLEFWNNLGATGHIAVYAGLMSILAVIFGALSKKDGWIGSVAKLVLKVIDFFSANIAHKTP